MELSSRICIIPLIGLPAAGKTTFCQNLLQLHSSFNIFHVCFDDYFRFEVEVDNEKFSYKIQRKNILEKVQNIVKVVKENREIPIHLSAQFTYKSSSSSNDFVIICDDNNYYTGMRYDIYQICKAMQIGFGQIYFSIDLESALLRNHERTANCVPQEIIYKMKKRIEHPNIVKNKWETHSLTIDNVVDWNKVLSFLQTCLNNPVVAYLPTENLKDSNDVSQIHHLDLLLRGRIKNILMKTEKTENIKVKAENLNRRRKIILDEFKRGKLLIVDDNFDKITTLLD